MPPHFEHEHDDEHEDDLSASKAVLGKILAEHTKVGMDLSLASVDSERRGYFARTLVNGER